jgi:hypothetical protein
MGDRFLRARELTPDTLECLTAPEAGTGAAKRARNTEAARKSRAKKMERQATSERRIEDLQKVEMEGPSWDESPTITGRCFESGAEP